MTFPLSSTYRRNSPARREAIAAPSEKKKSTRMATLPLPIVPRTVPLSACAPAPRGNRPAWLKVRFPNGQNYNELKTLMREQDLHTICEEALCPNIGECWENRTATFLILGEI